jgi:hypothetical protein
MLEIPAQASGSAFSAGIISRLRVSRFIVELRHLVNCGAAFRPSM